MSAEPVRLRPLGDAFDVLGPYRPDGFFFERAGVGLCGWGAVDRIDVPAGQGRTRALGRAATERLRAFAGDGERRPVAVGSIPFLPGSPASLTVPAHVAVRGDDGSTARVDLADDGDDGADARWVERTLPHGAFSELQVRAVPEPAVWEAAVERAVAGIRAGGLRKVVLARTLSVDAGRALDPKQLLWRARSVDPNCYAFAAPAGGGAVLVGATPELLVSKRGRELSLEPLAGSAPRAGDPGEDRRSGEGLLASEKDREEHAIVVEGIRAGLEPLCDDLDVPDAPELLGTANVWHLASRIRARLRADVPDVLAVVDAIHPTAAVGGSPSEAALAAIRELEPFDRGGYAGPVGWIDAAGDGRWAIALRCAELSGTTARLFAGAGIVAGSAPAAERDETDGKFRALLDALRWG